MKHLLIFLSFFFITCLFGCESSDSEIIDPNLAQLEVYVFGTVSNEPRDDIRVTIHATENDAEDNERVLHGPLWTNSEGIVSFRNIEPGKVYWIRAKPVIGRNVKATPFLSIGNNNFAIGVL